MKAIAKTKLIETTAAAATVIGSAAAVLPHSGFFAAAILVAGALASLAVLDSKPRAY